MKFGRSPDIRITSVTLRPEGAMLPHLRYERRYEL